MQQQQTDTNANDTGWMTTRVAAAALGVKPQQVRNYIAAGELEAKTEGAGAKRRYLVSAVSVEDLRAEKRSEGEMPGRARNGTESLVTSEQDVATLVRELATELSETRYQLGRTDARLESSVQTESALREQLQKERERAERLEAERERLVPDLLRERDRANTEHERAEHFEAKLREALEARRGWFRRFFGF